MLPLTRARPKARAKEIAAGALAGAVLDRTGVSVADTIGELALAGAAVGLDSGLSHAGVALGIPTVLLFGPNDPASVEPVETVFETDPVDIWNAEFYASIGTRLAPQRERQHDLLDPAVAGKVVELR